MKFRRRCKCGCGGITNYGKKYISGHNPVWNKGTGKTKIRRRCKCGCGRITNSGNKYIHGHNRKDKKRSTESILKTFLAKIKYNPNDLYCDVWRSKEYRNDLRKDYCENANCRNNCKLLNNHHIDLDKKNCHPNNIMTLCASCHTSLHRKIEDDKHISMDSKDFIIISRLDHVSYINKKTRKKVMVIRKTGND